MDTKNNNQNNKVEGKQENNVATEIKDFFKTLVISIIIVFFITTFLFKPIRINGDSMYPTLHDQSIGLAGVITKNLGIQRFDIVTVKLVEKNETLIKRVIGLPNETIEFKNDVLYIDGKVVNEDFLDEEYVATYSQFTNDFKITLNEDEYFLMGDNRPNSSDSRYYGPFSKDEISTSKVLIIFPFNRIGVIE